MTAVKSESLLVVSVTLLESNGRPSRFPRIVSGPRPRAVFSSRRPDRRSREATRTDDAHDGTTSRHLDRGEAGGVGASGLSICIPVLQREDAIAETLERCLAPRAACAAAGVTSVEVIVVDDGSSDATAEHRPAVPAVRLIRHPVNRGYGAALKTGFAAATHDLVGFLDADATYPPEQFPRSVPRARRDGADLVIGSRMAGAETEMPLDPPARQPVLRAAC